MVWNVSPAPSAFPWRPRGGPLVALRNCQIISSSSCDSSSSPSRNAKRQWPGKAFGSARRRSRINSMFPVPLNSSDHIVHSTPRFHQGSGDRLPPSRLRQLQNRLGQQRPDPHPGKCAPLGEPPGYGPWPDG